MHTSHTWDTMREEARKLSDEDLRRHANVSINSQHSCEECFCCACVVVYRERKNARFAQMYGGKTVKL